MSHSKYFIEEKFSSGFGIDGIEIEQTLSQSFDPHSALDIDTDNFTNTRIGFHIYNKDKRIPLGCFAFDDVNKYDDNFPDVLQLPFKQIPTRNLVPNGGARSIKSIGGPSNDYCVPHGWGYCTYDAVNPNGRQRYYKLYESDEYVSDQYPNTDNVSSGKYLEENGWGQRYIQSFLQSTLDYGQAEDNQFNEGYSGYEAYFFDWVGDEGTTRDDVPLRLQWNLEKAEDELEEANEDTFVLWDKFQDYFQNDSRGQMYSNYNNDSNLNIVSNICPRTAVTTGWDTAPQTVFYPNIAKWVTNRGYSNRRSLNFLSTDISSGTYVINSVTSQSGAFSWDDDTLGGVTQNQYRSLNQVCKIYNGSEDGFLNKNTILEVKFKMYTDSNLLSTQYNAPEVEVGIVDGDGRLSDPRRTSDRLNSQNYGYYKRHVYHPQGEFNTQRYNDDLNSTNQVNKKHSAYGSMGRFKNTKYDTWEEFSFKYSLGQVNAYTSTGQIRHLWLIVQAANNFYGNVFLDDFEVYESQDFIPDCDVRKKIAVGSYGEADLTKYHDKDFTTEENYKDTQAPLEAQFYFYPTYPTEEIFNVSRTPMYQEFKQGRFYLYDVDWGDGSPKEFSTKPEQIDEEKVILHTYEQSGVFEVTGLMLRMKVDEKGQELGIIKHKKFRLRISVNEGLDGDFEYFGSEGFSFIPYKNATPIVGGVSKQSAYYKSIKRQLGYLGNQKINILFNSPFDKLKTELALLKIEEGVEGDLEVLPKYMTEVTGSDGNVIYDGLDKFTEELGKGIGDCNLTNIKYYNKPKSIWETFGFDENDLSLVGNPNSNRYWKNIIPKNYSIFNRDGLIISSSNLSFPILPVYEQDWLDADGDGQPDYYYPVLPKYKPNGEFLDIDNGDENIYPNNKTPFPLIGSITDENEHDKNLIINIPSENLESNVLDDKSGNQNYGHVISDYKVKFDDNTLKPSLRKKFNKMSTAIKNGAF